MWTFFLAGMLLIPPDSLSLEALLRAADAHDPANGRTELFAQQTEARIRQNAAVFAPAVSVRTQVTGQSDAPSMVIPGVGAREVPLLQGHAVVAVEQVLYDGGRAASRSALERALLDVRFAARDAERMHRHQQVLDAYALRLSLNARLTHTLALDSLLAQRETDVQARIRQGTTLEAEALALAAERLRLRQTQREIVSAMEQNRVVLASLSGLDLPSRVLLSRLPETLPVAEQRPERRTFASRREAAQMQEDMAARAMRPQVRAFASGGVARPGYDFFDNGLAPIAQVGVQISWPLLDGRKAQREAEWADAERALVGVDEALFDEALLRATALLSERISQLDAQRASDSALIALRERLLDDAQRRVDGGSLPGTYIVDRMRDLYEARLAHDLRTLDLQHARLSLRLLAGPFTP